MSSAYQEYKNRVTFKGATKREYVKNKVKESIDDLIFNSQYGFKITVAGEEHDVAILSTRTTQEYEAANVIAHLGFLDKGVVFNWDSSNWIVLKKMFRPDQPGFNGIAYKCTDELKWIDSTGVLNTQPAYVRSGRITNALGVTPDKNEYYDNIILHNTDWSMMAATPINFNLTTEMRFLIKGQAYRVSNIDNVSIEGVSILSMVADKLLDSDDITNSVAARSDYYIDLSIVAPVKVEVDETLALPIVIYKDGVVVDEGYTCTSSNGNALITEAGIKGIAVGSSIITCTLDKNTLVTKQFVVDVTATTEENADNIVITGKDYILWNTTEEYSLSDNREATFAIETSSKIRKNVSFETNSISISVEDKYSGTIVITAIDGDNNEYTKEIVIKTN
jgi:hypothetical protein